MVIGTLPTFVGNGYLKPLDEFMDNELKPTVDLIGNIMNSWESLGPSLGPQAASREKIMATDKASASFFFMWGGIRDTLEDF